MTMHDNPTEAEAFKRPTPPTTGPRTLHTYHFEQRLDLGSGSVVVVRSIDADGFVWSEVAGNGPSGIVSFAARIPDTDQTEVTSVFFGVVSVYEDGATMSADDVPIPARGLPRGLPRRPDPAAGFDTSPRARRGWR